MPNTNMRHIVTLKPGAMVGEIALFSATAKRMATVRTKDHCEVRPLRVRWAGSLVHAALSA